MKHNKSNIAFVHEIVIIFVHLLEATNVISSFNLKIELQKLIPDAMFIPWIYRSP